MRTLLQPFYGTAGRMWDPATPRIRTLLPFGKTKSVEQNCWVRLQQGFGKESCEIMTDGDDKFQTIQPVMKNDCIFEISQVAET